MKSLASGVLGLLFPPHCMACGAPLIGGFDVALCEPCFAGFEAVENCCRFCGTPLGPHVDGNSRCESCKGRRLHFKAARGAFVYDDTVKRLLHRLKFENFASAAAPLALMAAGRVAKAFPETPAFSAVVPVPAAFASRFKRGYDQTLLIARILSRELGLPLALALFRTRRTGRQVELSRELRLVNLDGAFGANPRRLPGKGPLLLVDDVITTSSTASECAKALLEAGSGDVYAFAVARQP